MADGAGAAKSGMHVAMPEGRSGDDEDEIATFGGDIEVTFNVSPDVQHKTTVRNLSARACPFYPNLLPLARSRKGTPLSGLRAFLIGSLAFRLRRRWAPQFPAALFRFVLRLADLRRADPHSAVVLSPSLPFSLFLFLFLSYRISSVILAPSHSFIRSFPFCALCPSLCFSADVALPRKDDARPSVSCGPRNHCRK